MWTRLSNLILKTTTQFDFAENCATKTGCEIIFKHIHENIHSRLARKTFAPHRVAGFGRDRIAGHGFRAVARAAARRVFARNRFALGMAEGRTETALAGE